MEYALWGATGQAKVARPILDSQMHQLQFMIDNKSEIASPFPDIKRVFSGDEAEILLSSIEKPFGFLVAIGGVKGRDRWEISRTMERWGLSPLSAIHRNASVASSSTLGIGLQIMAGACISEDAIIGDFTIINTNATVDHDCCVGRGVHIMPGATLAGEIRVGDFASIGTNATILPRMHIGIGAIVGAGAVVTKDVPAGTTVVGVPARALKSRENGPK